jgi:hypothetical protein
MSDEQFQQVIMTKGLWWRLNHRLLTWHEWFIVIGCLVVFGTIMWLVEKRWK